MYTWQWIPNYSHHILYQLAAHICGKWVQECQQWWGCCPGFDVEDWDAKVEPGHAEWKSCSSCRGYWYISNTEVSSTIHHLPQHPIPVPRRNLTPILQDDIWQFETRKQTTFSSSTNLNVKLNPRSCESSPAKSIANPSKRAFPESFSWDSTSIV